MVGGLISYQVTGGGGLAGIDVADNDDVDVSLVFLTVSQEMKGQWGMQRGSKERWWTSDD